MTYPLVVAVLVLALFESACQRAMSVDEAKQVTARFAGRAGRIQQRKLNIDGDAGTYAYRFTGDLRDVDFL